MVKVMTNVSDEARDAAMDLGLSRELAQAWAAGGILLWAGEGAEWCEWRG